ncbi:unnamed protein product [Enterobius vermicularis]|uniref:Kinase n=1 Tax=Enterobius vermicularis TaxID=51028 RepID=A0A0N4VJ44_ENTVE|nr:unnamed protein product [Enterobius vermicularis]
MIAYTSYKHSVTRFTLIIVADLLELFFHSYTNDGIKFYCTLSYEWLLLKVFVASAAAYGEFLSGRPGEGSTVAQLVLTQLYEIQKWFHNQRVYHFYASSILIVYEAKPLSDPRPLVRLIDFSHVFPSNGNLDDNYIFGLDNVIRFIEQYRDLTQQKN